MLSRVFTLAGQPLLLQVQAAKEVLLNVILE